MTRYSTEIQQRYGFCDLQEISAKAASKKEVYETAEKIVRPKPLPNTNSLNVEEIAVSSETKHKIQNELKQLL